MKRRFKGRTSRSYKGVLYIFLFSLSFLCTIKLFINENNMTKEYLLSSLINEGINNKSVLEEMVKEQISSPKYMIYNGLNKIVEKNNLSVFSSIEDDDYNYEEAKSDYVEDPSPEVPVEPIVYIYNTHQLEEYSSNMPYDYSVKPNVMIASYIMREKLKENEISSVVETRNVKDFLTENKLSYNRSYLATENFARDMMSIYPSIKYLIDLHRDSVEYNVTAFEKDGKKYARILFVVGLEHTLAENNVGFAESLDEIVKRDYPGLSRGVLKKTSSSSSSSSVYNQNLNGKSVLIEVGGVDNSIEEINNTIEVLSKALSELIKGELWKRNKRILY